MANVVDEAFDPAAWKDRRVFITGHTGFIGGWLSMWLLRLGARVSGYALQPPTRPSFFDVAGLAGTMPSVIADVRDLDSLMTAMGEARPDTVIHLAAQPLVRLGYADPVATFDTNVMGTVNLLQAVAATESVRSVVVMTSDKVYENREWAWGYRESDALGGRDPYACSKACAELVVDSFRRSYFEGAGRRVGVATVRAGNVLGGGDWAADRIIPDAIRAFEAGRALRLRNPDARRPWQHVLEPLAGILGLAHGLDGKAGELATGWNFGPDEDDAKPVSWIADRAVAAWGDGAAWTLDNDQHPHEATMLAVSSAKARRQLGWRGRWRIGETIDRGIEWYKAHGNGADMRELTLSQIEAYESRA